MAETINKLLLSFNSNVVYLRSDEYKKKGFKILSRYIHPNFLKNNSKLMNNRDVDKHNERIFKHNKENLKQLLTNLANTKKRAINI